MKKKVSVVQAKAQLSALMAEVEHKGQHILIERRGKPIAALVSIKDLERLEAEGSASSDLPLDSLEIEGAWEDVGDAVIDAMVDVIYKARDANTGRDVDLGLYCSFSIQTHSVIC